MPADFDFDPQNSDLSIGIELEYPRADNEDELFVSRGHGSDPLRNSIHGWPSRLRSSPTYDGTVGLEVVSNVIHLEDIKTWYADVLDHLRDEYGAIYQPTGLMEGGSTAGTHIHISSITEQQARELADMSSEPWMQVLFCSSIAGDTEGNTTWPVFRGGGYVNMNYGNAHYDVVNRRDERRGHYEWRLPEPMIPEHLEILQEFLRAFEQSPEAARSYAQRTLDNCDDRITAIKRAEHVGMDIDSIPEIKREQSSADPESFFEMVSETWHLPNIYCVTMDGTDYYLLDSELSGEMEAAGISFNTNTILYADSLNEVEDQDLYNQIRTAYTRRGQTRRETDATEELKKIVKKKQ